jgi:hypothetical protein
VLSRVVEHGARSADQKECRVPTPNQRGVKRCAILHRDRDEHQKLEDGHPKSRFVCDELSGHVDDPRLPIEVGDPEAAGGVDHPVHWVRAAICNDRLRVRSLVPVMYEQPHVGAGTRRRRIAGVDAAPMSKHRFYMVEHRAVVGREPHRNAEHG